MPKITVTIETKKTLTAEDVAGMIGSKDNINVRRKLPSGGVLGVEVVEVPEPTNSKPASNSGSTTKKPAAKKAATKKAEPEKETSEPKKDVEI